jgi:hypothetical protein
VSSSTCDLVRSPGSDFLSCPSKWPFLRLPFLLALSRNDGRYKVLCIAIAEGPKKRATCHQLDHLYSQSNACAPRSIVDLFKKQSPTNWNVNLGTSC